MYRRNTEYNFITVIVMDRVNNDIFNLLNCVYYNTMTDRLPFTRF